jgi:hypothetical protein
MSSIKLGGNDSSKSIPRCGNIFAQSAGSLKRKSVGEFTSTTEVLGEVMRNLKALWLDAVYILALFFGLFAGLAIFVAGTVMAFKLISGWFL